jgi:hypothetical protein
MLGKKSCVVKSLMFPIMVLALFAVSAIAANVPTTINFQGRLTNTDGTPKSGTANLVFKIYPAVSGGSAVWTETQNSVSIAAGGLVSVQLGITQPLTQEVFEGSTSRWLEITVDSDVLSPRTKLVATPYAIVSERSYGVIGDTITTSNIKDGTITNADIDAAAAISISKLATTGNLGNNVIASSISMNSVGTEQMISISDSKLTGTGNIVTNFSADKLDGFHWTTFATTMAPTISYSLTLNSLGVNSPPIALHSNTYPYVSIDYNNGAFRIYKPWQTLLSIDYMGDITMGLSTATLTIGNKLKFSGTTGDIMFPGVSTAIRYLNTSNQEMFAIQDEGSIRQNYSSVLEDGPNNICYVGDGTNVRKRYYYQDVNGVNSQGWRLICSSTTTMPEYVTFIIEWNGNVRAHGTFIPNGVDIAETFDMASKFEPGDVVSLNPSDPDKLMLSNTEYDTKIVGIISEKPGVILKKDSMLPLTNTENNVALAGRVPCKVTTINGPISVGDLLTTSTKPGVAMKATPELINGKPFYPNGCIIGKAMGNLSTGDGIITVLVNGK